ncbi:MAG: peptide ABC transporter substrate-binding protein [Planctomycetes bacterium]|nr:peptide ABC transporter substrate-binding protein [Planctomycetota bacterium]
MIRLIALLIVVPTAAVLLGLALIRAEPRAEFVVASDELRTIDPHRVSYMDEIQVANCLFEGLTRLNADSQQPEPGVAESWTISPDRRSYRFSLRADARWSDGSPVNAEDFRFAWLRALDPAVQSQYASLLFPIEGAEAFYKSLASGGIRLPAESVAVSAPDDRTLEVHLRAPCAYFLDLTAFPTLHPLPRPTIERWAYRDGHVLPAQHEWTKPENLVCNGPFRLHRWEFKRRLLLSRNPHYWDRASLGVETIEIAVAMSPAAQLLAYETGRVDLVRGVEPEVGTVLRRESDAGRRTDFHVGPRYSTFFLRVNCRREPFESNPALRRALALAIDRRSICDAVLGLGETPADTFVPRAAAALMPRTAADGSIIHYQPPVGLASEMRGDGLHELPFERCVELARDELRKSGFDPASRLIRLAYASDPPQQKRIVEAIQAMWERSLGLRVELEVMERKVLAQRIRALDYDVVRSDWYGDYMDPATFLEMFTSGNSQNRTGWSNETYDRLIGETLSAVDEQVRFDRFREAERLLCVDEMPIIPVYFKTGNYLLRPTFGGFSDNVRDTLAIAWARRR